LGSGQTGENTMNLQEILSLYALWLSQDEQEGAQTDLRYAVLSWIVGNLKESDSLNLERYYEGFDLEAIANSMKIDNRPRIVFDLQSKGRLLRSSQNQSVKLILDHVGNHLDFGYLLDESD
jgi:hypothetical protein